MAAATHLTEHLKTFVDVTRSPTHHAESLKAIATSLEKGVLSINQPIGRRDGLVLNDH
ncbi:unnamed protein product [Brassica rapa subsp. narinosa]